MGCVSEKRCRDCELPVRTVTFAKPFAIGKYEVTFTEYDRFAEATGREKPDDWGWGRGLRPVINVSWDDAKAYASWLSEQTGKRYRLASEAEWEYATRGGTVTPFSTGECIDTDQANYNGNFGWQDCARTDLNRAKTLEAGSLPANPLGLHEVHGNVWEWAQDCWHDSYKDAPTDGSAWEEAGGGDCVRRVLRGGSWNDQPADVRSALRNWTTTEYRNFDVGFRLAQDLGLYVLCVLTLWGSRGLAPWSRSFFRDGPLPADLQTFVGRILLSAVGRDRPFASASSSGWFKES